MKIILISGLSGSGKSVALRLLEDVGYYCIDNMPMEMMPDLVRHHILRADVEHLAVSVDIRSRPSISEIDKQLAYLRRQGHSVELLFLESDEAVLMRRFSETRRSHPLAGLTQSLQESLRQEREMLAPLREKAYCIDSSSMNSQQLRYAVQQWLKVEREGLLVVFESFGFKYGVPTDIDFLFDMRSLPNPYYDPALRPYNGKEQPIRDYLATQPLVNEMIGDIFHFLHRWLPRIRQENRSYVTIAIGCTGGQHRSVYIAEQLGRQLADEYQTLVFHRQLS